MAVDLNVKCAMKINGNLLWKIQKLEHFLYISALVIDLNKIYSQYHYDELLNALSL